jgi:hypothetical protein
MKKDSKLVKAKIDTKHKYAKNGDEIGNDDGTENLRRSVRFSDDITDIDLALLDPDFKPSGHYATHKSPKIPSPPSGPSPSSKGSAQFRGIERSPTSTNETNDNVATDESFYYNESTNSNSPRDEDYPGMSGMGMANSYALSGFDNNNVRV